jgi:hypothetical protein
LFFLRLIKFDSYNFETRYILNSLYQDPPVFLKLEARDINGMRIDNNGSVNIHENQQLTVMCAFKETNPKSKITLQIGNRVLETIGKNHSKSEHTIKMYYFETIVTRELRSSKIICKSEMLGLTNEVSKALGFDHSMVNCLDLNVYCKPIKDIIKGL